MSNNTNNPSTDVALNFRFQLETKILTHIIYDNALLFYADFLSKNNFTNWKSGHNYQDIYEALTINSPNFSFDFIELRKILAKNKKPSKCLLEFMPSYSSVVYSECITLVEIFIVEIAIQIVTDEMNRLLKDLISLSSEQQLLINTYKEVRDELNLLLFDNGNSGDKLDFFSTIAELPQYLEKFGSPNHILEKLKDLLSGIEMKISKIKNLRNFHSLSQQLLYHTRFCSDVALMHTAGVKAKELVDLFRLSNFR